MGCEACPEMTVKQRLMAVVACCALGYCIEAFSTLTLLSGKRSFSTFATMYVFGNVLAILATCFWVGPKRMCSRMWKPTRRIATSVYLSTLILVFVLALLHTPVGVMMLLVCVQARARRTLVCPPPPPPCDDPLRRAAAPGVRGDMVLGELPAEGPMAHPAVLQDVALLAVPGGARSTTEVPPGGVAVRVAHCLL